MYLWLKVIFITVTKFETRLGLNSLRLIKSLTRLGGLVLLVAEVCFQKEISGVFQDSKNLMFGLLLKVVLVDSFISNSAWW